MSAREKMAPAARAQLEQLEQCVYAAADLVRELKKLYNLGGDCEALIAARRLLSELELQAVRTDPRFDPVTLRERVV